MERSAGIVLVLCAILALNVIAIVLLSNRPIESQPEQESTPEPEPIVVAAQKPLVRTLVLEDPQRCPDCTDIRAYAQQLEEVLAVELEDAPAEPFAPVRLPALAFNATIEQYPEEYTQGWESYGSIVTIEEGEYTGTWYVLPTLTPPYLETETDRVRGYVNVTYLGLSSCEECYDPHELRSALAEALITPHNEVDIDAASAQGKALIAEYNITILPIIILEGDMDAYPSLRPGWEVVGSIEEDGAWVLRDLQRMQVIYYDTVRNEVMRP